MSLPNGSERILELATRYYRWYPPEAHLGHAEEKVRLRAESTALMLVDPYLPSKFDPDRPEAQQRGSLSEKDHGLWRAVIERSIVPVLRAARMTGLPVIYVCNSSPGIAMQHSAFAGTLRRSLDIRAEEAFRAIASESGSKSGADEAPLSFIEGVVPQKGDYLIGKTVYSGFFNTPLDGLLRNLRTTNVVCAGFRLDACLLATALDALYRNYQVILIRDATLGCELPSEIDRREFTARMALHFETLIGPSTTSADFIKACRGV